MRTRKNKKKGFTLIELIIVIAILAILAAILIPNMMNYMEEANKATRDANAQMVFLAAQTAASAEQAKGGKYDTDIGSSGSPVAIEDLSNVTYGNFGKAIQDMLGSKMDGKIFVDVDSDTGAVIQAGWIASASGATMGYYPKQ